MEVAKAYFLRQMRARLYGKAQLDFITLFHSHYRSLILSAGTYKYITKRTVVLARLLEGMILIVVALLMMGRLQNYFEKEVRSITLLKIVHKINLGAFGCIFRAQMFAFFVYIFAIQIETVYGIHSNSYLGCS